MTKLREPALVEYQLAQILRLMLISEIARLGEVEAAERLDLAVPGVRALLWYSEWPIERSLRVLESIGLPVVATLRVAVDLLP